MSIAQQRFGNMLDSISIFTDTTQDLPSSNVASVQEVEQGNDLGERLYDYATSNESAAGFEDRFFWGTNTEQLTRDQLEAEFNDGKNSQLQGAFGSFDNYMAYMDERQDLIDAGELKSSWWASQDTVIDVTNQSGLAFELDPEDANFRENINDYMVASGQSGYSSNSQIFNALYQKYTGGAADGKSYNDDGDVFRFNGSSFVRTYENPRGGFIDTALPALIVGVAGAALAGPLAAGLQSAGLSGAVASATAQSITNAAIQLAATGEVSISDALMAGASSIAGNTVASALQESGALSMTAGAFDAATQVAEIGEQGINAADVISAVRDYIDMSGGEVGGVSVDYGEGTLSGQDVADVGDVGDLTITPPEITKIDPDDSEDGGGSSSADSASVSAANPADASVDPSTAASGTASDDAGSTDMSVSEPSQTYTYGEGDESIVARQIHEAIILEENSDTQAGLIKEWEDYTGQTWNPDYMDQDPYEGYDPDKQTGTVVSTGEEIGSVTTASDESPTSNIFSTVTGILGDAISVLNQDDDDGDDSGDAQVSVVSPTVKPTRNTGVDPDFTTPDSDGGLDSQVSDDPPASDPATDDPPAQDPPADDPPTQDPPTDDPPVDDPPIQDPPTQDPPTQDPPTDDAITSGNGGDVTTAGTDNVGDDPTTTGGDSGGDGPSDGPGDDDGNGDDKGRGQSLLIGGMMRPTLQPQRGTPVMVPNIYDPMQLPGLLAIPQSRARVELEKVIADLMMPEQRKPSGLLLGTLNSRNVA